jgi:hypothetical protein
LIIGQKCNQGVVLLLPSFSYLAVGAASVKMASDYNESLNKVDVAFKGSSAQGKRVCKTSLESFGITVGTSLISRLLMVTWVLLWG